MAATVAAACSNNHLHTTAPMSKEFPHLQPPGMMEEVNFVYHVRKTPLLLTGIFLNLTRTYWSDIENLPVGVNYTWVPDEDISKVTIKPTSEKKARKTSPGTKDPTPCAIRAAAKSPATDLSQGAVAGKFVFIDKELPDLKELLQQRPAIVVGVGDIAFSNVSGLAGRNPEIGGNLVDGETHYARRGEGSVVFRHIGRTNGEAMILAGTTLDYYDAFSPIIKKDFCFETFTPVQITKVRHFEESTERYECSVVCNFSFQDTWTLKLESPKLKAMELRINELSRQVAE